MWVLDKHLCFRSGGYFLFFSHTNTHKVPIIAESYCASKAIKRQKIVIFPHISTQSVRYCLSMFTIITQTKTMYNSWMLQAHFISVMSRLLHSVKWSSTRHSTQRLFHRVQNLKRTESTERKKTKTKKPKAHLQWFTWIQSSGTIAQRYSLWNTQFPKTKGIFLSSTPQRTLDWDYYFNL